MDARRSACRCSRLSRRPRLFALSSRQWKRRRETVRLLPLAPRERAPLLFLTERIIEGDLVVPVYTQGTRRKAAGEPRSRERGNEFAASKGKSESSSSEVFQQLFFFLLLSSPTSKAFTFRGLFGCSLKWNKDPGKYESVKAPMAERLRRSTRMVWYHGLGCELPGTIITLLSNSERSVGSIPTRREHIFTFATLLWRRGEGKEGRKKGRDKGVKTFFCSLWGVDVSLRAERAAGAKKVFLFVLLRGCSRRIFLYWTRHGPPPERRRREKKKKEKGEGKSTAHGRRQPLEVGFLGEREEEPWREDRVLSPPPLFRESVLYASFGEQPCLLLRPFFGLLAADGCGSGRPRLGRRERASRGRNSRWKKKEETSLFVSFFHSLHPSFLVQQQQQHETACSAPPLNFRMRPA